MKGKLALVLISLLLLAAPVFAEVNVSGEFVYGINEGDDYSAEEFDTADLIFEGVSADGFASVVMGLDLSSVDTDSSTDDIDTELSEDVLDSLYATLDVTGAADLDSPVDVTFIAGKTSYSAEGYLGSVRGYTVDDVINAETTSNTYLGLNLGVMDTVNVVFGIDPDTADDLQNMFVGLSGTFGIVKAEVYYNYVEEDQNPEDGDCYTAYGADFTADLDFMTFGAGFEYNDVIEETKYSVGARTGIIDRTDMGISFAGSTETDTAKDEGKAMEMGIDANYAITDAFKVYAGVLLKDLEELDEDDMVGFEVSVSYTFKEDVTAYVGYATKESGLNAEGPLEEDSVFFTIAASF